jgi:hypothetical protein
MLDLKDGHAEVWHQFAGATLPGDFIVAEDQERAFQLKRDEKTVVLAGALPEPGTRGLDDAPLTVTIRNPIDRPITAVVRMRDGTGEEWIVPGEPAVSRTPQDTHNPAVTDLGTPVTLGSIAPTTIAPHSTASLPLTVDCPALTTPLRAPEAVIEIEHARDAIETVPVELKGIEPISTVREQEVEGFPLRIIEEPCVPGWVLASAPLVEVKGIRTVETT